MNLVSSHDTEEVVCADLTAFEDELQETLVCSGKMCSAERSTWLCARGPGEGRYAELLDCVRTCVAAAQNDTCYWRMQEKLAKDGAER